MFIILVVSSVLLSAALAGSRIFRPNDNGIVRHQRALAALSEAERRLPSTSDEKSPAQACTDHVHILDEAPAKRVSTRRRPRSSARRLPTGRRRNAAEIAARPTIACLPTTGHVPTMSWSTPVREPAPVELVSAAVAPEDLESVWNASGRRVGSADRG